MDNTSGSVSGRYAGDIPEEVWRRVKIWAQQQAQRNARPTFEQCVAEVERISKEPLSGRPSLPREVVEFYAAEAMQIIEKTHRPPV